MESLMATLSCVVPADQIRIAISLPLLRMSQMRWVCCPTEEGGGLVVVLHHCVHR